MDYKFENGVFLARMQPYHIAHQFLIEEALRECRNVLVVLGSANKKDMLRNPFDLSYREEIVKEDLAERGWVDTGRVTLCEIPDWSFENDTNTPAVWGAYLYANVVARIQAKKFAIYYSDDLSIIRSWFKTSLSGFEVYDNVTIRHYERTNMFEGLSVTKIREAILASDDAAAEYLSKFCPPAVIRRLDFIRNHYSEVYENPYADFSMN